MLPERFCLMNIQSSSTYPPLLQGLSQGLLIHQASSRGIDQERALTHLRRRDGQKSRFSQLFTDKRADVRRFFFFKCVSQINLFDLKRNIHLDCMSAF